VAVPDRLFWRVQCGVQPPTQRVLAHHPRGTHRPPRRPDGCVAVETPAARTGRTPPPSVAPETDTVMFSLGPVGARWRPEEPLKRYWQCDIWGPLFDALLNHEGVEPSAALGTARYAQTPRSAPGAYAVDLTGRRGAQGTTGGVFDAAGTPADTHAQGAAAGAGGGAVARAAAGGGDRRVSARARRWAS
jgi:hypothetical protein